MKSLAPFFTVTFNRLRLVAMGVVMALTTGVQAQIADGSTGPKPEMTLSISGDEAGEIFVGEPLTVHVWLSAPDAPAKKPLRVKATATLWPDAIALALLDARGNLMSIAPRASGLGNSNSLVLSARQRATVTFRWKSAQIQTLKPGRYEVRGKFRCRILPWEEQVVEAEPLVLEVKAFPPNPTPEQSAGHAVALARGLFYDGDLNGARSQLGPFLKKDPGIAAVLVMHARILEQEGDINGALVEVSRALPEVDPKNAEWEPPVELLEYHRHLVDRIMTESNSPVARPSASVSTSPAPGNANPASKPTPATARKSFSGNWSSKYGTLTLVEENGRITGVYPFRSGKLEGTVVDGVARFEWKSDLGSGRGYFRISDDGNFFKGAYAEGTDDPEQGKPTAWGGARMQPK